MEAVNLKKRRSESTSGTVEKKKKATELVCCLCFKKSSHDITVRDSSFNSCVLLAEAINTLIECKHEDAISVQNAMGGSVTPETLTKVRWHYQCYKKFTHKKTLKSVENRMSVSQAKPNLCFFCDLPEKHNNPLRNLSHNNSLEVLKSVVEKSDINGLRDRLSESMGMMIASGDSLTPNIMYHPSCWLKIVIRDGNSDASPNRDLNETARKVSDEEFVCFVQDLLSEEKVLNMADLHEAYLNICRSNNLDPDTCRVRSRRELKELMLEM